MQGLGLNFWGTAALVNQDGEGWGGGGQGGRRGDDRETSKFIVVAMA